MKNKMEVQFSAQSKNVLFARVTVAAFISQLDPTVDELTEIKTVVSEAVTNAIIHGYENNADGMVYISVEMTENEVFLTVRDEGIGIFDIEEAREPLYTSKPELERSGMGFTIMENFMDEIEVESIPTVGTAVRMKKQLSNRNALCN